MHLAAVATIRPGYMISDDKDTNTQNAMAALRESTRSSVAEVELRNTSRWDCTRQAFQFVGHKLEATETLNSVLSHS